MAASTRFDSGARRDAAAGYPTSYEPRCWVQLPGKRTSCSKTCRFNVSSRAARDDIGRLNGDGSIDTKHSRPVELMETFDAPIRSL